MVFTLGLRHTLALWQRAMALVQPLVVQALLALTKNFGRVHDSSIVVPYSHTVDRSEEYIDWSDGDFDGNGTVDTQDFLQLSPNFSDGRVANVPEPTCCLTLILIFALSAAMKTQADGCG